MTATPTTSRPIDHPSAESPGPDCTTLRLKTGTADLHHSAERSPFQRTLIAGQITRGQYAAWLRQLHALYSALEHAVDGIVVDRASGDAGERAALDRLRALPWRHTDLLANDLAVLAAGEHPAATADAVLPATSALLATLDERDHQTSGAWLALLYVLEGSTNGNKYIARGVQRSVARPGEVITTALDPHGDAQVERWRAFKAAFDAVVPVSGAAAVVEGAREVYHGIHAIGDALDSLA